jgi:hypothetical protein
MAQRGPSLKFWNEEEEGLQGVFKRLRRNGHQLEKFWNDVGRHQKDPVSYQSTWSSPSSVGGDILPIGYYFSPDLLHRDFLEHSSNAHALPPSGVALQSTPGAPR